MRKAKPPPVNHPMLDKQGNLTRPWWLWFQAVGMFFDDFRRNPDIITTTDYTLTTDDFGKVIRVDNGTSNVMVTLMTVSSKDVNCWLNIIRTGSGRLTIVPDSATRIEYGSYGGRIWNDEARRHAANVTLQLITSTQWGIIGATGIWKIR